MEGRDTDAAVAPLFSTGFVLDTQRVEMIKTGREGDVRDVSSNVRSFLPLKAAGEV